MDFEAERRGGDGIAEAPTGKLIHDFLEESKRLLAEGKRLLRAEIEQFFRVYKELEGHSTRTAGFGDRTEALRVLAEARARAPSA